MLEAFAFKKCVIGYYDNFYAIEGTINEVNCLIANTPEDFLTHLANIEAGIINVDEIAENAYKLVDNKYRWHEVLKPLMNAVEEMGGN